MKKLIKFFVKFYKDEEGIELVEWVLMAVLLALAVTAGIIVLGGNLNTAFSNIAACVQGTAS